MRIVYEGGETRKLEHKISELLPGRLASYMQIFYLELLTPSTQRGPSGGHSLGYHFQGASPAKYCAGW
jgi:hypothetical protein